MSWNLIKKIFCQGLEIRYTYMFIGKIKVSQKYVLPSLRLQGKCRRPRRTSQLQRFEHCYSIIYKPCFVLAEVTLVYRNKSFR